MSVTFGFYNSLNHDRKYNASHMSSIFDGIINDGIFQSIGTAMIVKATSGMIINVGVGRAWFNHTWTLNDAILPITVEPAELLLKRIDAVVLEVDSTDSVRANSIKIIKGTPSSVPVAPTLVDEGTKHQHLLALIDVGINVTEITQENITNKVGTEETPFITGILKTMSIDDLILQWGDQWNKWLSARESDRETDQASWDKWNNECQAEFDTWFQNLKNELDTNQVTHLQNEIDQNGFDILGFVTKTTVFNPDGSISCTDANGRVLKIVFNPDGSITETLTNTDGVTVIKTHTTVFNPDGSITETASV